MFSRITLTPVQGGLEGKEFVLNKRGRYVVGRAADCDLCLCEDLPSVSRHHCVLNVEPPTVSIRDLGSCNGTFVNGAMIGRRSMSHPVDEAALDESFLDFELNDGDVLRLGKLVFLVGILEPSAVNEPAYFP